MSGDRDRGVSDLERYEQLRARVLSGEPDGFRMGLEMLERRGVVAWARAWQTAAPAPALAPGRAAVLELRSNARQIVNVLATIALASAAAG